MISSVASQPQPPLTKATPAQTASAQKSSTEEPSSSSTQPAPSTVQDTVTISSAAKAALQEATETSTQTAQEAQKGDHQAQRLLAKEEAARASAQSNPAEK